MSRNRKYLFLVLCATVFALTVGQLLVGCGGQSSSAKVERSARAPVSQSQVGSPFPGIGSARSGPIGFSEIVATVKNYPSTIRLITFVNGSNEVVVAFTDDTRASINVPEPGGKEKLMGLAESAGISVASVDKSTGGLGAFLWQFGPVLLLGLIILYVWSKNREDQRRQMDYLYQMQQSPGQQPPQGPPTGGGRYDNTGKSIAHEVDTSNGEKVTFDDVAGCEEAIHELRRIVKGLVHHDVYKRFDAQLPKGVLLVGPPGTGKTLLAKAVAGEADGTFDSTSGSDFVEIYVGVGAARVRDMFANGRRKVAQTGRPHVIFIDEIDAVGKKRSKSGGSGGHQEREQTLNALLVEMDGMKSNEGLIVLAATNIPEVLDDALTRPGRFDCQVSVDLPDKEGRALIFGIHTRKKPLGEDVTLEILAARTYGYNGAEIAGACNRAAILAAERYGGGLAECDDIEEPEAKDACTDQVPAKITLADFDEGIDFVRYGDAKSTRQKNMAAEEKKNTAYHEAGHACVGEVLPDADPVVKVTIMGRSRALGYVQSMPAEDRHGMSDRQLVARIITLMAGRASQEEFLNKVDTGASNDFEQATNLARRMVTSWGMSRLGQISVPDSRETFGSPSGSKLADAIDEEWQRIVKCCYEIARKIVASDRDRIEHVVKVLLDRETIIGEEWQALMKDLPSKADGDEFAFNPAAPEAD